MCPLLDVMVPNIRSQEEASNVYYDNLECEKIHFSMLRIVTQNLPFTDSQFISDANAETLHIILFTLKKKPHTHTHTHIYIYIYIYIYICVCVCVCVLGGGCGCVSWYENAFIETP